MLIKIDNKVINTDHIVTIYVYPDGKGVRINFTHGIQEVFRFPHSESLDSFLKKIGLNTYFA